MALPASARYFQGAHPKYVFQGVFLVASCLSIVPNERRPSLRFTRAIIENTHFLHSASRWREPIVSTGYNDFQNAVFETSRCVLSQSLQAHLQDHSAPRASPTKHGITTLVRLGPISKSTLPTVPWSEASFVSSKDVLVFDGLDVVVDGIDVAPESADVNTEDSDVDPGCPYTNLDGLDIVLEDLGILPSDTEISPCDLEIAPPELLTISQPLFDFRPPDREIMDDPDSNLGSIQAANLMANFSSGPIFGKVILILQQLRRDLAFHSDEETGFREKVRMTTTFLKWITRLGTPETWAAKPIRISSANILKEVLARDQDGAATMLPFVLWQAPIPLKPLIRLMNFIKNGGSPGLMTQALEFILNRPSYWRRGSIIITTLHQYNKTPSRFAGAKELYKIMQESGLFQKIILPHDMEYAVRNFMVMNAIEAGDDSFISEEIDAMDKRTPDSYWVDVKLQGRLIMRAADTGRWEDALRRLKTLSTRINTKYPKFMEILNELTTRYSLDHSAEELELMVRSFHTEFGLTPTHRWGFEVMDGYARRQMKEPLFNWLRFCSESGVLLDDSFVEQFAQRGRDYWCFSEKSVENLKRLVLQARSSRGEDPIVDGLRQKPVLDQDEALEKQFLTAKKHDEVSCDGSNNLIIINSKGRVPRKTFLTYDTLREQVKKLLGTEPAPLEKAKTLVHEAHQRGVDVTKALVPLQLALLKAGEDPKEVVRYGIQMQVPVHNIVYYQAARELAKLSDFSGAADMCVLAADRNGQGHLLYNKYNFASLVFIFTGTSKYETLDRILTEFISENWWWHGGTICKDSIKLAMKAVAMRVVVHQKHRAKHMNALNKLDKALQHVKDCRETMRSRGRLIRELITAIKRSGSASSADRADGAGGNGPRGPARPGPEHISDGRAAV